MRSLVAPHRRGRLEGAEAVQAQPLQDPADGCRRDAGLPGNRLAGQALEPQRADPGDDGLRSWAIEPLRPRGPVRQTGDAFDGITRHPFADGARTDACGSCGGPRGRAACPLHGGSVSDHPGQAGIVVDVHPVLLWNTEASQPQLPRSGPDGQPMESSQLAANHTLRESRALAKVIIPWPGGKTSVMTLLFDVDRVDHSAAPWPSIVPYTN